MKILTIYGFLPNPKDQFKYLRLFHRITLQIFLVMLIIPSIVAVYRSLSEKDMELTLRAFYYLAIQLYITTSFFSSIHNTKGLCQLFDLLEDQILKRQNTISKKYYVQADKYYSLLFRSYMVVSIVTLATMVIPSVIATMQYYVSNEQMAENHWIIPFHFEIPFKIDNLWKYSLVITLSALSIYGVALGKIIIHELYYRGAFQIIACTMDLRQDINDTSTFIQKNSNKNVFNSQTKLRLRKIILFHQKILDFFQLYSSLVSGVIFFEFISLYFLIGSTGFLVAQNLLGGSSQIIQFKTVLMACFTSMLMTSKLGTEISLFILKLSSDVYSMEWNELPLEFQKYFPIILHLMQKPRTLTGYGIMECNWLTFTSVFKAIVSFILLLRQFV